MRCTPRSIALTALTLVVAFGTALPLRAQADDPEAYDDGYVAGNYGRVQYHENGLTLARAEIDGDLPPREEGQINSPVFPGDTVLTDTDQRVEIQLASGALVRIDRGTEITFLALPDPTAKLVDNTVLQLVSGSVRLATLRGSDEFRVDTPAGSVYVVEESDVRIDVGPGGRTTVLSRRGVAELVGQGGSVLVRGGMSAEVFPDELPSEPRAFNTFALDGFDRWVDDRVAVYRAAERYDDSREAYRELPAEVRPYYGELSRNGRWVYVGDYGYVWRPLGVVSTWRPYYDGYWSYGPHGYFWVSHEPWGWAPYHYGRWHWIGGHGWCWIPGRVFAGAWVAWSWGSAYVGWAPLDYWNRPAYIRSVYWDYYDPLCWTFLSYRHVNYRHYHRHAVAVDRVAYDVRRASVVTRAPRVPPQRLADSAEWRDRAARLARDDGRARMAPIDRAARPARDMRDVDRQLASARTRASAAPGRGRATSRELPNFPRRAARDESPSRDEPRSAVTRGPARPTAPSRGSAGRTTGAAEDTDRRVRDLYRRMASPRTTRERTDADNSESRRSGAPARATTTDRSRQRGSAERPARRGETGTRSGSEKRDEPADRSPRAGRPSWQTRPSASSVGRSGSQTRPRNDRGTAVRPRGSSSRPTSASRPRSSSPPSRSTAAPRGSSSRSGSAVRPRGSSPRPTSASRPRSSSPPSRSTAAPRGTSRSRPSTVRPRSGGSRPQGSSATRSGGSRSRAGAASRSRSGSSSSRKRGGSRK